jgi:putative oxidoreductase
MSRRLLWALQILAGVFFIVISVVKLSGAEMFVRIYNEIGLGSWLRYTVAAIELTGGIALFIPRPAVAALALAVVTVGGVITQLSVIGVTPTLANPVAATVVLLLIAWGRRPERIVV